MTTLSERSVLGCILLEPHLMNVVHGNGITPDTFSDKGYRGVYSAMLGLHLDGKPIDMITVAEKIDGDVAFVSSLQDDFPYTANIDQYISGVKDDYTVRQLRNVVGELGVYLENNPGPEALSRAEYLVGRISEGHVSSNFRRVGGIVDTIARRLEAGEVKAFGLPTGFPSIDRTLHGMHPGNLIIVAGRPGMGKSALALCIAYHNAKEDTPGAFISFEMSGEEQGFRLLSYETLLSQDYIKNGQFGTEGWNNISSARDRISKFPLWIEDHGTMSALELQSNVRRLQSEHGIKYVIVDYLQLMQSGLNHQNRDLEIGAITRALKQSARLLEVPVIALSQLSRKPEGRTDTRPILSDLRESGNIEQDADAVMFVYRPGYYSPDDYGNETEIIIAKNRNGRTHTVQLKWEGKLTKFMEKENDSTD